MYTPGPNITPYETTLLNPEPFRELKVSHLCAVVALAFKGDEKYPKKVGAP